MAVEPGTPSTKRQVTAQNRPLPAAPTASKTAKAVAKKPVVKQPIITAQPASAGGATSQAAGGGMLGKAGTDAILDSRIRALMAAAPGRITIQSSFRTRQDQQRLYDLYISGKGNLAAKPGNSNHEKGLAFDLGYENDATRQWVLANASRFGLTFPISSEPWHAEPVEIRGQQLSQAAVRAGLKPLDAAKAAANASPAGALGNGSDSGSIPTGDPSSMLGADGKVDPARAIEEYGYIAELAKSVPDIQKVLTDAITNGWTPTRFTAAIQSTNWWKKTSESQRQVEVLKKTNPGEYRRQRQQMVDNMVTLARNLGVEEGSQRIFILAEKALALGWSNDEIQRYLAADVKVKATGNTGQTAVTVDSLKEQAAQYAVPMSDATLQQWTTQVLRGMVPMESFQSYLKEQAKSLFPGLAKAIDSGVTVEQYVEPYKQLTAQTLEVNPESITINDPRVQKALFSQTKDGTRTSMTLSDYTKYLRSTPDFRKTRQASEQAAGFAQMTSELFGKVS